MTKRRILLDCDPGIDDAIAILLALAAAESVALVAITTVAGNVPLALTERNARRILTLAGRSEIPVAAGCARPLMSASGPTAMVHGNDGLGGVPLPEPDFDPDPRHGVDLIVETALAGPAGALTLCATGPLTNLAMALVKEPRLTGRLSEIVLMGGACFRPGNTTASAEFNFHVDPHAAQIVLSAGVPLTLFPLDVTMQVKVDEERLARIDAVGTDVAATAAAMLRVYGSGDTALHDACVIAHLIEPGLFSGLPAHVEVVTAPGPAYGQSIAHVTEQHLAGRAANALAMTEADADGVFALLTERLARL